MTVFQRYFLWYLLFINLVGVLAVCWDKLFFPMVVSFLTLDIAAPII